MMTDPIEGYDSPEEESTAPAGSAPSLVLSADCEIACGVARLYATRLASAGRDDEAAEALAIADAMDEFRAGQ